MNDVLVRRNKSSESLDDNLADESVWRQQINDHLEEDAHRVQSAVMSSMMLLCILVFTMEGNSLRLKLATYLILGLSKLI
jgi:hypothetical protein